MKTLVYSTHGFDKPFMERAAEGKHELGFTEKVLNETTTSLARGFEAVALFTSDNASGKVMEQLHQLGVKYISLRS
jgi:D-lactate dehydrogenase